jgi:hypothetical protein
VPSDSIELLDSSHGLGREQARMASMRIDEIVSTSIGPNRPSAAESSRGWRPGRGAIPRDSRRHELPSIDPRNRLFGEEVR